MSPLPTPATDITLFPHSRCGGKVLHEQGFNATGVSPSSAKPASIREPLQPLPAKTPCSRRCSSCHRAAAPGCDGSGGGEDVRSRRAGLCALQYPSGFPLDFRLAAPSEISREAADLHPEIRPPIKANFDGWIAYSANGLDEAGDRLSADLDRDQPAGTVLTIMEGGLMQRSFFRDDARFPSSALLRFSPHQGHAAGLNPSPTLTRRTHARQ